MSNDPVLVLDSPGRSEVPLHFRKSTSPFVRLFQPEPPRTGLDRLRISGSHQFSEDELRVLARDLPPGTVIVDLRQESHGFVNTLAVSWYSPKDFANEGKPLAAIQADEDRRLADLRRAGTAVILKVAAKDGEGRISAAEPMEVAVESARHERDMTGPLGFGYQRIPVKDHSSPPDGQIDRFLALWRDVTPRGWLHFHCHAGEGRTTAFLAMADMLVNAREVGFEDIVRRQGMLGGLNLLEPALGWKGPLARRRKEFLRRFYAYAAANPGGEPLSWAEWIGRGRSAV